VKLNEEEVPAVKEESSYYLLAAEVRSGVTRRVELGGRVREVLITPFGAVATRVIVEGEVVFVGDVGGEGGGYMKLKLRDPTGDVSVYADRYQDDLYDRIKALTHGERVRVIASVRSFVGSGGRRILSLRAVEMRKVDEVEERLFPAMALLSLLRRDAHLRKGEVPPGVEEEWRETVSELYSRLDREVWANTLRRALKWLKGEVERVEEEREEGELDPNEIFVLEMLKELSGQEGVRVEDLQAYVRSRELSFENVMEAIRSLLEKGVIYEPTLGIYKIV